MNLTLTERLILASILAGHKFKNIELAIQSHDFIKEILPTDVEKEEYEVKFHDDGKIFLNSEKADTAEPVAVEMPSSLKEVIPNLVKETYEANGVTASEAIKVDSLLKKFDTK